MTEPNDTEQLQTSRPEDDDPIALTGEPADAPEGAEEGALFEDTEDI